MTASDTHRTINAIFRIESPKLIAGLARIVRDVGIAEELAQDALVAALEQWPREGVPDKPGAWLMAAAKHRAIDQLRRKKRLERKHEEIGHEVELKELAVPDFESALDDPIGDDLLRLVFTSCHPVLSTEARVAMTLRLLGGLTTEEIARAFLVPEPTIAQRIVRAKRTLSEEQVPFEVPRGPELAGRLASVLEVIYLVFNEGYSATAGDDWLRPALCEDALRLGRVLVGLVPDEPEVHGLVALMEIQASRAAARTGPNGEPILLLDQNRAKWDRLLVSRGIAALARAEALGGAGGPYALQAAIAACHARARTAEETDWPRIAVLYYALAQRTPSPIVELNRAVALAMAFGPAVGLELVDELTEEPSLQNYHLLPSVRGDLLFKLGRKDEAKVEFERAASLTKNARERDLLLERGGMRMNDISRAAPIISIQSLSKTYASGFQALKNVSLDIRRGEIFALLGPNGAGKTTLIGVICGIVRPTAGKVLADGHDIVRDYRAARSKIGLVPQELSTDLFESVWATTSFSRGLFGKPKNPAHVEKVLRALSLWDKRDSKIMTLSGGMKRRVLIAKALSHEPSILFLDEPTAGVDVELRRDMWAMVRSLRDTGVTVILTTHYIEEAEEMADRIGVIHKGEIIVVEEKARLMEQLGKKQLFVHLTQPLAKVPPELDPFHLETDGAKLVYTYDAKRVGSTIAELLAKLSELGIGFKELESRESSLEDIFVSLVRSRS